MRKYRKAIAAVLGVSVLVALRHYQVAIPGMESIVVDLVIGALTAFGVYQVPNDA